MFWTAWLRRRARRRVRRQMRGYIRLKSRGRLDLLSRVRHEITDTPLDSSRGRTAPWFFGASHGNAEMAIRQYLLLRVITPVWLYRSMLQSIGSGTWLLHPLPPEWREVMRRHGFQIPAVRAEIIWRGYLILLLGYGVISLGRTMLAAIRGASADRRPHAYAHFVGLTSANLPRLLEGGDSHDVLSWYSRWPGRVGDLDALCHSAPQATSLTVGSFQVRAVPTPLPAPRGVAGAGPFAAWALRASALAVLDLLRGRWWHPLLLSEAGHAAAARRHDGSALAREYLFHNSDSLYRPLWTYEVEARGSRVTFYFYSTNNESFHSLTGPMFHAGSWQVMRWPRYLVWDAGQAAFVKQTAGPDANIDIVGPIPFSDSAAPVPDLPQRSVAVFDVQPFRTSRYRLLGLAHEFYTPPTASAFLLDIHHALAACDATMALKRKRQIGALLHRRYAAVLRHLQAAGHFVAVPPDASAQRVIERTAAVISMPFTSTALLARALGKPSAYYDPFGAIAKNDPAAHGIPILAGRQALRDWLEAIDLPAQPAATLAPGQADIPSSPC